MADETSTRVDNIHFIQQCMQQLPTKGKGDEDKNAESEKSVWKDVFSKILERTIYEKAREKMN